MALAALSINKNQKFVRASGDFTPEIYLPILMFAGLMILSFIIKKKFFDVWFKQKYAIK